MNPPNSLLVLLALLLFNSTRAALGPFMTTVQAASAGPQDLTTWTFMPIDVPGADWTYARDMNPAAQIVGEYWKWAADTQRGFLLSDGVFTDLEVGEYSGARGINIQGDIVGWYCCCDGFVGFLLRRGSATPIIYPGADYTVAEGINAAGDVVGFYGLGGTEHGFLLRDGVPTTIDYPGAFATNARGINSEGDIVGLYTNNDDPEKWWLGPFHGFVLKRDGTFTSVDYPGSGNANTNGIGEAGQVVGEYVAADGRNYGFLLQGSEFTSFSYPGASITRPWRITPNGQYIVGFYDDLHGFVLGRKPLK